MTQVGTMDSTRSFDGLLLVDKPSGLTSHDVVSHIRRHYGFRKVGHGGTLDPMATGLLLILVGRGTKLSAQVMGSDKAYEGVLRLGANTDTQDAEGNILSEHDVSHVTRDALEQEMKKWTGDIMQTPPMVSAIKQNGVPLYKLARKGKTVDRKPRFLHIYSFKLLSFQPPEATFRVFCSKGTYVRTLCADIGEGLGCGGHLGALRRTKSGRFSVDEAIPLKDLMARSPSELADAIIPLHQIQAEE